MSRNLLVVVFGLVLFSQGVALAGDDFIRCPAKQFDCTRNCMMSEEWLSLAFTENKVYRFEGMSVNQLGSLVSVASCLYLPADGSKSSFILLSKKGYTQGDGNWQTAVETTEPGSIYGAHCDSFEDCSFRRKD